jgi:hypothetical protein
MICRHCRRGADLLPELKALRAEPGRPKTHAINGLVRRINNAHRDCLGGSWCDCQHRGTKVERKPQGSSDRPPALVSAGFPPMQPTGTPGVMKTVHVPAGARKTPRRAQRR